MGRTERLKTEPTTRRLPQALLQIGVSMFVASTGCTPGPVDGVPVPSNRNGAPNANGAVNENANTVANGNGDGGATEPVFPANYREIFTEVRDCRFSIEHGGVMIRVLANEIAVAPYRSDANPLPVGSVLLKEEYTGTDCTDDRTLVRYSVMRKEAPGFDPGDGDWHWQYVAPDRRVTDDRKTTCLPCHNVQECLARDYMCTVP
jgi:hypothetical protein